MIFCKMVEIYSQQINLFPNSWTKILVEKKKKIKHVAVSNINFVLAFDYWWYMLRI